MLSTRGFIQYLKARRELGLVKRSELLKAGEFSRNTEIRVHCVFVSVDGYYCLLRSVCYGLKRLFLTFYKGG